MRIPPLLLALLTALVAAPAPASALVPHDDRHDFDDLEDGVPVGAYYEGYRYDAGVHVACRRMPGCAAMDVADGELVAETDLLRMFTRATGWCGLPYGFGVVTVELTDVLGGLSRASCNAGIGGGHFLVTSSLPARRVAFYGPAGDFLVDHLVFSA